jgi:hypothetical protein
MADLWLEPYEEAIAEFPVTGNARAQFAAALRYAVRAPSVHNTQPWWCRVRGGRLEVHADERRRLARADPAGRELVISCGALVEHLHVVVRRFGFEGQVEVARGGPASLMATVELGAARRVDPLDRQLFDAIFRRRTNRRPFRRRAVPETLLERAVRRAAQRGATLGLLRDAVERALLADLVTAADRIQMADPSFRRELASWLRRAGTRRTDGIPAYAGKAPKLIRPVAPLLVRTFDLGDGVAAFDRRLASGSPALAVLWTRNDDRLAWLDAGRALARLLLTLAAGGVSASFLNQATEVPEMRAELDAALGRGQTAQVALRLGYGEEVRETPRRPVSAILRP